MYGEELHQVSCQIATRKVRAIDDVREHVVLVSGNCGCSSPVVATPPSGSVWIMSKFSSFVAIPRRS